MVTLEINLDAEVQQLNQVINDLNTKMAGISVLVCFERRRSGGTR
jgi:hypothetical protein